MTEKCMEKRLIEHCAPTLAGMKSASLFNYFHKGEPITVISHIKGGCVVSIKDARYNIDTDLAKAISI